MSLASLATLPMTGKKWLIIGISFLVLIIGAFIYGNVQGRMHSKLVLAEYQVKLSKTEAELEKEKGNIKERIVIKWRDRDAVIDDQSKDAQEGAAKTDENVILSKQWVCIHNNFVGDRSVAECYQK